MTVELPEIKIAGGVYEVHLFIYPIFEKNPSILMCHNVQDKRRWNIMRQSLLWNAFCKINYNKFHWQTKNQYQTYNRQEQYIASYYDVILRIYFPITPNSETYQYMVLSLIINWWTCRKSKIMGSNFKQGDKVLKKRKIQQLPPTSGVL